jgi:hypothetical protein
MGHVVCMWAVKNAYRTSDRKLVGRITPDRPSFGWENNIKIDLNKQNCICLADYSDQWWSVVNLVVNCHIP